MVEAGRLGQAKSRVTQAAQKIARIQAYDALGKGCLHCGTKIPYVRRDTKFCNQSCAASYNNRGVRRHGNAPAVCKQCAKPLAKSKREYCSAGCHKNHIWVQTRLLIEKRGDVAINKVANSKSARRYLRETRGACCAVCRTTEWCGREVPLVLDHIDGNADNWLLGNLRLICGNCDMQTATYKGKNRGHGRFARRQRYHDGKSF